MSHKPLFTVEQIDWLCYQIGEWYLEWKHKITVEPGAQHRLGIAKEALKEMLETPLLPDPMEVWRKKTILSLHEHPLNGYKKILEWKEDIVIAFVAKYGLQPDEVEIVQDGLTWYVRKRQNEEVRPYFVTKTDEVFDTTGFKTPAVLRPLCAHESFEKAEASIINGVCIGVTARKCNLCNEFF